MAVNKETVCFVLNGGAGSTSNAGGATKAAWDAGSPSDFMSATGAPIVTDTTCTLGSDGVGSVNTRISGSSSLIFDSIVNGTVAYVSFDATAITDGYENGYYEVQRVDGESGQLDLLDCTYTASAGTCDIWIGGAFDDLNNCANADIMNAEVYTRTCYVQGDVLNQTAGIVISAGGNDGNDGNIWKQIIGVDENWNRLPVGEYVTYDSSGSGATGLGTHGILISTTGTYVYGIAQKYPAGSDTTPASYYCLYSSGSRAIFENCYGEGGYFCLRILGLAVSCVAVNPYVYGFFSGTHGVSYRNCSVIGGAYSTNASGFYVSGAGNSFDNCLVVDVKNGIQNFGTSYYYIINNCTFVRCSGSGVYSSAASSAACVAIANCLFIDDGVGGKAIDMNLFAHYENYNICDHSLANSGFKGVNSYYGLDLSDVLTDINNGDYSINTNSTVAQQYIIGKGTPLIYSLDNPSA